MILTIIAASRGHKLGGFDPPCEAIPGLWRNLTAGIGPRSARLVCLRSARSPDTPDIQETFPLLAGTPAELQKALRGGAKMVEMKIEETKTF